MKVHTFALGLLALNAAVALAGGIDRSGQGLGALFEPGNYVEGSFSQVSPSVTGVDVAGGATGNVVSRYPMVSLSAKLQVSPALSVAVVMDQPYGAKLLYANSSRCWVARGWMCRRPPCWDWHAGTLTSSSVCTVACVFSRQMPRCACKVWLTGR
jgi:hypothetical protein